MLMGEGYGINAGNGNYTNKEAPVQTSVLSFLRSGYYNYTIGGLNDRGLNGRYWSSRATNIANAYYLYFYSTSLYFSGNYDKGRGFTLRCGG